MITIIGIDIIMILIILLYHITKDLAKTRAPQAGGVVLRYDMLYVI